MDANFEMHHLYSSVYTCIRDKKFMFATAKVFFVGSPTLLKSMLFYCEEMVESIVKELH